MNPSELEQQRVNYVRVTNGLDFPFTDRHDGVPVTIQPGKSENLPVDMATHFFGFNPNREIDSEAMFRHICKRQGWNTPDFVKDRPDHDKTLAREYFDKLKIEAVAYKLVPADKPDPRTPIPAEQHILDDKPQTFKERRKQAEAQA
jgi:hypothetical protein